MYATWHHQTFITSGHYVVDLPTVNYPFGIFQTFITNGHCVVDLPTSNYRFGMKNCVKVTKRNQSMISHNNLIISSPG